MGSNGRYNKIISIKKMWSSKERCGFGFHDLLFFSFWISLSVRNYFFFCSPLGCVAPNLAEITYFFFVGRKKRPRDRTFLTFCNTHTHTHTHTEEETAKQQSTTFNSFYYSGLYIYYTIIQLIIYR